MMVNLITKYIPDDEFVAFIKGLSNDRKRLAGVDGFTRWHIKEADGSEYILRPESSRKNI